MAYVDLHTHSIYSDGTDSPRTLVRNAAFVGLDAMALTDHDSMEGLFEASREAHMRNIVLIPGVEVTTPKYHILGLGVQRTGEFAAFLERSRGYQYNRSAERCKNLRDVGVPITIEKVREHFPRSRLGKWNITLTLWEDPDCREYFLRQNSSADLSWVNNNYMKNDGPGEKTREMPSARSKEAIDAIHAAGGVAILAHPFKDVKHVNELDSLVRKGLDGIEIQPHAGLRNDFFRAYAIEKGLIITYGSDYHGLCMDRKLLGRWNNSIELPLGKVVKQESFCPV